MRSKTKKEKRTIQLKYYLAFTYLILIISTLTVVFAIDYVNLRSDLETSLQQQQNQIEFDIVTEIKFVDSGLKMFEKVLEEEMVEVFDVFIDEYNQSSNNPLAMNLTVIKDQYDGRYDLYVFNKSNIIIATTYEPDLGLNLGQYKKMNASLNAIREGDNFVPDRIIPETLTGILRKFAFMPTPDHEYLLELGLNSSEFVEIMDELDYITAANEIVTRSEWLTDVRVFSTLGYLVGDPDYQSSTELKNKVKSVYRYRDYVQSLEFRNQSTVIKYIFVDLSDPNYATDVSKIVELTYDLEKMDRIIIDRVIVQVIIALIFIGLSTIITFFIAGRITAPIHKLLQGIEDISKGEMVKINEAKKQVIVVEELVTLENSINRMSKSINLLIKMVEVQEEIGDEDEE